MDHLFVDALVALERIDSISDAASRAGAASLPAVDVGASDPTETLGRLGAGVASFPETLRAQLAVAGVVMRLVVDDACAADSTGFT